MALTQCRHPRPNHPSQHVQGSNEQSLCEASAASRGTASIMPSVAPQVQASGAQEGNLRVENYLKTSKLRSGEIHTEVERGPHRENHIIAVTETMDGSGDVMISAEEGNEVALYFISELEEYSTSIIEGVYQVPAEKGPWAHELLVRAALGEEWHYGWENEDERQEELSRHGLD